MTANVAHRLARDQSGLIREIVFFLAVVGAITVIMLDVFSVMSSTRTLREDASRAAAHALTAYVDTGSDAEAAAAARKYLESLDVQMVSFQTVRLVDRTVYRVTATGEARTYVFKYLTHLPWVGSWIHRQLNHTVTEQTD